MGENFQKCELPTLLHFVRVRAAQTNNIYHSKLLKISLFSGPSFGHSGRSEFMLKKTLNLTKSKTLDRVDSILRVS